MTATHKPHQRDDEHEHGHDHLFFPNDIIKRGRRERIRDRTRLIRPGVAGFAVALLLLAAASVIVAVIPNIMIHTEGLSAADRLKAQNDVRTALLQASAGLALLGGLFFTARTVRLTRSGQVTDRFSKAVEQIGNGVADVRVGGLYSLEKIARDSAEFRPVVTEMVVHYIHGHTKQVANESVSLAADPIERDVQVALGILGRRLGIEQEVKTLNLWGLNLNKSDLSLGNFSRANLCYATIDDSYFEHANLSGATLVAARIRNSSIAHADCTGATFTGADLAGTYVTGSDLTGADLQGANLAGVDFSGRKEKGRYYIQPSRLKYANVADAVMKGANLCGVDLRDIRGLTQQQLDSTNIDGETRLPLGLSPRVSKKRQT
ncbi:pentapeptide repeat-containing protein [Micromonospora sp. RP3T]|uniref:pentapeptide repeat-containing protein n=1 Tax=Micromonospora sp. RP3T TaxID=2135446 RepID=UPI001304D4EF|nr:pentapeptide repeat-containing protein [Micromonospora sp. RP3T]